MKKAQAKKVFISYSHKDEEFKDQFETHLSGLKNNGLINIWSDRKVHIGEEWDEKIKYKLKTSDIVIFLISSDFLASEYINEIEIKETIRRHENGEVYIAPIYLRPCDIEYSLLSKFQGVPRDIKFISTWKDIDSGFLAVVTELKKIITDFQPIEKPTIVTAIPGDQILIPCDTPPDIAKWVGREEELSLLNSTNFKVIFITGIGGQGKSSLAARYVFNQSEINAFQNWDWRDFKSEENRLKTKLFEIIQRFSTNDVTLLNLKDATYDELIEILFKAISDKKILFVFDNIDSYIDYESFNPIEGFNKLIQAALKKSHHCKFIFTCRPFIKKADVGFYQMGLPGLSFENTKLLLNKYNISVKQNQKEDIFKDLHEITNGHPLWLNLLGAQAVRGVKILESFIENIREHTDFDENDISKILSGKIIGAIWKSLNHKQQKLLRCLTELVKSELVEDLAKIVENELNYNQFNKALKRLKLLNLVVTKTQKNKKEEIELHPLVKSYVKGKYPQSERTKFISIIINYYDQITIVLKERLSGNESMSFYENWTNKVELAVNKNDFDLALSTLEEIQDPILTAGYFEEYIRVSKILFHKINFTKIYNSEVPYFVSQILSFVELTAEVNDNESARFVLDNFQEVITSKSTDYIKYCYLECSYNWHNLNNKEAIKWGEKGMKLLKSNNYDFDLEHRLNLAKRDSLDETNLKEALIYFLHEYDVDELVNTELDENLSAPFYGNIGRCYFFLKEYNIALKLFAKSFKLCYSEDGRNKFMNRGYILYWMGQLLEKLDQYKNSYLFFSNCIFYWDKFSPHRARRVEDEIKVLKTKIPDINDLLRLDNDTIEKQCKTYISNL